MAQYKLTARPDIVLNMETGATIPEGVWLWNQYQDWLAAGNTPLPVDLPDRGLLASQVRVQRDSHLFATEWLVQRHRDEIDLGRPATLNQETFNQLMAYRQALRDVPLQTGFPERVDWPKVPSCHGMN
ncbi:phage tail assembly chaperone [Chromobacterium sp. IIBBL 290-4]|uniref:phage tail assembly chaperone n=1 Tax=Chromobacterium sp. IIBBL 290-4 TaxID=2953890 RepID=UPI0020B8B014|nr:phage tail assembly chaperone [Chromobacterium sp. IIBBL 290-4]UTH76115.1 phage tail assembly chaperone [Chromobacterium sp. IIBBL 290-4]